MCIFITATLSPDADIEKVKPIARSCELAWKQIKSGPILNQLKDGETYFLTTVGFCDCSTDLGSAHDEIPEVPKVDINKQIIKLKKMGWGEAKINRWSEEKEKHKKRLNREEQHSGDPHWETNTWIEFINKVLDNELSQWVGIIIENEMIFKSSEGFEIGKILNVSLNKLSRDYLLHMEVNTLYRFKKTLKKQL